MTIDHVGIAVEKIEAALSFYRDVLGLVVIGQEEVLSQGVRVAFLEDPKSPGVSVELLEPMEGGAVKVGNGGVAKFLSRRGPGMHHLAFRSMQLESDMKRLADQGRPPVEPKPRRGARGHQVCFVHPKHAQGVLIELVA